MKSDTGTSVRFNDLFTTVLSGRAESAWSRAVLWRQCLDLLAQYGGKAGAGPSELDQVAETLGALREQVPTERKLAAIRDLGGRLTSARLARLLLAEEAPVVAAAMRIARLADREWPDVIAESGPLARSVLRQRTDLGPEAQRALRAFGANDLSLIDLNARGRPVPTRARDTGQIRRIVDRIERFTSERQERVQRDPAPAPAEAAAAVTADANFSFVTDAEGIVRSAQGQPSALVVGLRLATPSLDRSTGPDGQILGAFRRRGAFRDGRLTVGEGLLAGCWLVDGDPLFDHRSGRFTGYRCHARRAGDLDLAPYAAPDADEQSTSLRQLIHELRTPLSGVMGFAELIEAQLLGPVDEGYRNMAGEIVSDVNQLVDILDDIDLANRGDRLRAPAVVEGSDIGRLLGEAVGRIGADGDGRPRIALDPVEALKPVDVAPAIAERMIAHFVRALAGCAGPEILHARAGVSADGEGIAIVIGRPTAMQGLSDAQLFDSGFEHVAVNPDAPVLGVGFALRLVRRLAQANGGSLAVHADHFALTLPAAADAGTREASS